MQVQHHREISVIFKDATESMPSTDQQPSDQLPHHGPAQSDQIALFDLEATNAELKADLRDLYIISAKEIEIQW
eukprot:gene28279-31387_t